MTDLDHSPSIAPNAADEHLLEIIAHLGAVLIQTAPTDDKIIIDHVRSAHRLALDIRRDAAHAATLKELTHEPI
jgi:hypothetical protein